MRIAITIGLLLLATLAVGQTVNYDFDRNTDFSRIKTYAWVQGIEDRDDFNSQRIMAAVDTQLQSKGLTRVGIGAKPDVIVDYRTTFSNAVQVNGFGAFPLAGARSARAENVTVGTLNVSIRDASTRAMLWKGIATDDIDTQRSPEKRDKKINKAVEKMFRNYPPKK